MKTRLYRNEGYKYIDVAQEDLRIIINLVDREEIEEEQIEMSNKNCELEFEVEKLQKENEELNKENEELKEDLEYVLNQTLGAFEKNWCIDWNFTEIREKYNLESE